MFRDNNGKISSKRVMGTILLLASIVSNIVGAGDPSTNQVMIWAGVAAIGVGTLETRVQK
jgi:hypothetical protein